MHKEYIMAEKLHSVRTVAVKLQNTRGGIRTLIWERKHAGEKYPGGRWLSGKKCPDTGQWLIRESSIQSRKAHMADRVARKAAKVKADLEGRSTHVRPTVKAYGYFTRALADDTVTPPEHKVIIAQWLERCKSQWDAEYQRRFPARWAEQHPAV